MSYPHLAARLYNVPLLIHPDKASVIESVFRAHLAGTVFLPDAPVVAPQPQALAYASNRFADKPYALTDAGVALIPVMGTLVQRGSGMNALSGMTGYTQLEALFSKAESDPDVKGILLELDSPGGEASGVFDLASIISNAQKPVWATSNEMAFSGAYAIGAAASRVVVPRTGRVGSVGVITMHVDQSKRDATQGYVYTPIYAGAKKADGNPHAPLTDSARERMQAMVDSLYSLFVSHVAIERGMSEAAVRATEAGTFSGTEAVDVGMADAVQSFNDTLAEFEALVSKPAGFSIGGTTPRPSTGVIAMSEPQATAGGQPPAQAAPTVDVSAEVAKASAAERSRIQAIQTCAEAAGREKLAAHLAFKTGMSAEEAQGLLSASPKEQAAAAAPVNPLAAAMAGVANPAVGADQSHETDDAADESAKILALHRKFNPR